MRFSASRNSFTLMPDRAVNTARLQPLDRAKSINARAAIAADLLVVVCYLPVPVLFYKLFKPVNDTLSLTAAFFGLTGCAVQGFACLFRIAPLIVLTSGQSSTAINQQQVQALAYLLLKLYTPAYSISLVFFAFAFVLIGCLVFKSTFLPRFLGVLAVISGVGWLAFLWPPL